MPPIYIHANYRRHKEHYLVEKILSYWTLLLNVVTTSSNEQERACHAQKYLHQHTWSSATVITAEMHHPLPHCTVGAVQPLSSGGRWWHGVGADGTGQGPGCSASWGELLVGCRLNMPAFSILALPRYLHTWNTIQSEIMSISHTLFRSNSTAC